MKLNSKTLVTASIAFALFGCNNPTQNVASANYLAGRAYALYELNKAPSSTASLNSLGQELEEITSSSTPPTPFQMGQLSGQVQEIKAAGSATGNTTITVIGSLIDSTVQVASSVNGKNPTLITAAVSADLQDFKNGISDEQQFLAGQQSVLTPAK